MHPSSVHGSLDTKITYRFILFGGLTRPTNPMLYCAFQLVGHSLKAALPVVNPSDSIEFLGITRVRAPNWLPCSSALFAWSTLVPNAQRPRRHPQQQAAYMSYGLKAVRLISLGLQPTAPVLH